MRLRLTLLDQVFGYHRPADVVITVQRWSGFPRALHGFVISRNHDLTGQRMDIAIRVRSDFDAACTALSLRGAVVSAGRADQALAEMPGGPRLSTCPTPACRADLPIGVPWCPRCSRPLAKRLAEVVDLSSRRSGCGRRHQEQLR